MKHFLIFFCIFILLSFKAESQTITKNKKSAKFYKIAEKYYAQHNNAKSLIYCDKSIKFDDQYTEPYALKAQIFSDSGLYSISIEILNKILTISPDYEQVVYFKALNFMKLEIYDSSIVCLKKIIKTTKNSETLSEAKKNLNLSLFRDSLMKNPVAFKPLKLSDNINTEQNEYFPTISAYNQELLFTRLVKGEYGVQEDIFISRLVNNEYTPAVSVSGQINTQANEGAHCLSADGMTMIFTRCKLTGGCDLYVSQKDETGYWLPPVKLPEPVNSRYWDTQPYLAPNGKTLYFVSNRPGGYGKMDIWKSDFLGYAHWSEPVNLGPDINTPGNEMSPFLHYDGKTFYFASDYYPGMGKFDLFKSNRIDDTTWTKPQNLGYPINTKNDEYRLVVAIDGKTAYYSSQTDTISGQDIYAFELPKTLRPQKTIFVRVFIFNKRNNKECKADQVSIVALNSKDTVCSSYNVSKFLTCLNLKDEYALNILKKNYLMYSKNFSIENGLDTTNYDIYVYLEPIDLNKKFTLKNLFFKTDSYNINPISYVELDRLVKFLQINPEVNIEISGHTDNVGSYQYNMKLSENRAKAVADYLESKGINKKRLSYKGYGFTKPIAENTNENGRKMNRRTEIIIIKK